MCCISKGKEHQMYEFGNKVSIVVTQNTGVIVGAKSFRNEFDGHTLAESLEQKIANKSSKKKKATVDRGYIGQKEIHGISKKKPKKNSTT